MRSLLSCFYYSIEREGRKRKLSCRIVNVLFIPVSYTHLDVYKRQPLNVKKGAENKEFSAPFDGIALLRDLVLKGLEAIFQNFVPQAPLADPKHFCRGVFSAIVF